MTTQTTTSTKKTIPEPTVYQSRIPDIPLHNPITAVMLYTQVRPHHADVETEQTPADETH